MAYTGLKAVQNALYKAQQKKGRNLTYEEALSAISMGTGYSFPSGTTHEGVLRQLVESDLVTMAAIHVENPRKK